MCKNNLRRIIRISIIGLIFFLLSPFINTKANATTYYVSTSGNNSNNGTSLTTPYKTIQYAVWQMHPGDTIYVRAGIYNEHIYIDAAWSGTAALPIIISGYNNERPIIDGQYTIPTGTDSGCDPQNPTVCYNYTGLIENYASYINIQNFEIIRSRGRGVNLINNHNFTVKNVWIHDVRGAGINTSTSYDNIIENNRIWLTNNYAPYDREATVLWSGGINIDCSTNIIISGNTVYNNWGEGILPMGSSNLTITNNISYDNYAVQIYSERTTNTKISNNLMYATNTAPFLRGGNPPPCLAIADEDQFNDSLYSHGYTITNNLMMGCSVNFAFWGPSLIHTGSGLSGSLIANNTMVNAVSNNSTPKAIEFDKGLYTGARFINNIVIQNTGSLIYFDSSINGALTFSNNLWSATPPSSVKSSTDIIGDPMLTKSGTFSPGTLTPNYFMLQSGSPTIDKGVALTEISTDFFNVVRPQGTAYDIGAHEFISVISPATPTISVKSGDANEDGQVNGLDYVVWLNHFGKTTFGTANGDFNSDNLVNGLDYVVWLNNFGK
jgi:parallel beta-helix repeat protein